MNNCLFRKGRDVSISHDVSCIWYSGKQHFIEWVSTPMEIQSSKNPELAKLYFMGFSTKEKREVGLQEYISKLKEQYDVLNAICKEAENVKVPDEDKDRQSPMSLSDNVIAGLHFGEGSNE